MVILWILVGLCSASTFPFLPSEIQSSTNDLLFVTSIVEICERNYEPPVYITIGDGEPPSLKQIKAVEYGLQVWSCLLDWSKASRRLKILVNWNHSQSTSLLASTRTMLIHGMDHFPNEWIPTALGLNVGLHTTSNEYDIIIDVNADESYYFETDGNPPSELFDFPTIILHELGHAYGFVGAITMFSNSEIGLLPEFSLHPVRFDNLINFEVGGPPIWKAYWNSASTELQMFMHTYINEIFRLGGEFFFESNLYQREGGIRLFTPAIWQEGSSIYHLDDIYKDLNDGEDSLMTNSIPRGFANHKIGPRMMDLLATLGYNLNNCALTYRPSLLVVVLLIMFL